MNAEQRPAAVECVRCGRGAATAEATLTWTAEQTGRGPRWLCADCTRDNLRSIESRLDEQWW